MTVLTLAAPIRSAAAMLPTRSLSTRFHLVKPSRLHLDRHVFVHLQSTASESSTGENFSSQESANQVPIPDKEPVVPLYRAEGLLAVDKPLNWTSNDVVSYIRGILERDARHRGANPARITERKNKSRIVRVGHGGTLDPLASGVLVLGVGKGTKHLQGYLSGGKRYTAQGEFGFETNTLDMEGNITQVAPHDHVTLDNLRDVLPMFTGKIMQVPPLFSAIRKGGKKLYSEARKGKTTDDIQIDAREVEIYELKLINLDETQLPRFDMDIQCGGGMFVRSLIRDIAYKLDTVATTTLLIRTKQAQFSLDNAIGMKDWTADNIYAEIEKLNNVRQKEGGGS